MWGWLKGDRKNAEEQAAKPVTRSDAEYLRLLNDLLDRLAVEPGYATLTAWSIIHKVREGDLAVWLRGAVGVVGEFAAGGFVVGGGGGFGGSESYGSGF